MKPILLNSRLIRMKPMPLAGSFIFALLALTFHSASLPAQATSTQEPATPQPANPYTLHVYANRIQLPTVVIDSSEQQVHSLTRDNFDITLDGGTIFHPSAARIEGDDPITLALLLDVSGSEKEIYKDLANSLAALSPESLHPKDHVSIYAVDCHVIRTLDDIPADPAVLKQGLEQAFITPGLHGKRDGPACGGSVHLWDAIATVANALSTKPGRRVMLVVSPGVEFGSKYSFAEVADFAAASGIAIFGMRDHDEFMKQRAIMNSDLRSGAATIVHGTSVDREDKLEAMCRKNGGIVFNIPHTDLPQHLQEFVGFLRDRYIIEYPRPDEGKAGKHIILISVRGSKDVVLPTGASTPLPDPAIAADPTTVPSNPSQATFGGRKHLDPKAKQ